MSHTVTNYKSFQTSPGARSKNTTTVLPPKRKTTQSSICKRCNKRICGCATGCKCAKPLR